MHVKMLSIIDHMVYSVKVITLESTCCRDSNCTSCCLIQLQSLQFELSCVINPESHYSKPCD